MRYVDGYVLAVPRKNIQAYRRMAQKAAKVWRDHGALEYGRWGEDRTEEGILHARSRGKRGETVVIARVGSSRAPIGTP